MTKDRASAAKPQAGGRDSTPDPRALPEAGTGAESRPGPAGAGAVILVEPGAEQAAAPAPPADALPVRMAQRRARMAARRAGAAAGRAPSAEPPLPADRVPASPSPLAGARKAKRRALAATGQTLPVPAPGPGARHAGVPSVPSGGMAGARLAAPARRRPRHVLVVLSFIVAVVLPSLLAGGYLFLVARDQYSSDLGFSIQREDAGSALDLLGGLAQIGGSPASDAMIVYKYITSRDMMLAVGSRIDVARAFTRPDDPYFSLSPGATLEQRDDHWRRMVAVFLDSASGLIELRVRAYTPEDAQAIAAAIRDESARLLNQLSDQAREDATRFARSEYELAAGRFAAAQAELTAFRTQNQIVDPSADLAGQSALLNSLVSEQAQALIDRDLLASAGTPESDPRFQRVERRIEVIGKRIEAERARISVDGKGDGTGYAGLVAEYEKLHLEFQMATEAYTAARAALAGAVAKAERTTRYLAVYMPPTLSQEALYPERITWSLLILAFSFALWSIGVLTFYAVRDRR